MKVSHTAAFVAKKQSAGNLHCRKKMPQRIPLQSGINRK
jgi:hypothetical protein